MSSVTTAEQVAPPERRDSGPDRALSRAVLINTISQYLNWFVRLGAIMVLVRLNTSHLDKDAYGFWVWLWSIFSAVFLLDLGLGFSLARFIPPAYARGDLRAVKEMISALFWFFVGGAVVILAVGLSASEFLPRIVDHFRPIYRVDFLIFTLLTVVSYPTNVFRDALFGLNRIAVRNFVSLSFELASFVLIWFLYSQGFGLRMLVWTIGVTILARNLACLIFLWRTLGIFPVAFRPSTALRIRGMLSFSLFSYLTSLSHLALKTASVTIIGFFNFAAAGTYNPARSLAVYFEDLTQQFQQALPPVVSRLGDQRDAQREIFLRLSRFALCISSLLYVPLIAHLDVLFPLWVPALDNLPLAIVAAKILITKSFLAVILYSPAQAVMFMADRHRPVALATCLGAAVAITLSILSWLLLDLGILGIAVAFTLGPLFGGFLILPDGWRFAQVTPWGYLSRVLLPALLPLGALAASVFGGLWLVGDGLPARAGTSVVGVLAAIVLYLAVVTEDRRLLIRVVSRAP